MTRSTMNKTATTLPGDPIEYRTRRHLKRGGMVATALTYFASAEGETAETIAADLPGVTVAKVRHAMRTLEERKLIFHDDETGQVIVTTRGHDAIKRLMRRTKHG